MKLLPNGPPVPYPVQFRVVGPDPLVLRGLADQVKVAMRANTNTRGVNDNWNESIKVLRLEIDQDKARLLGVSGQDLAALLNMSLNGYTVTSYREGVKTIDVVLRGVDEERAQLSALPDLAVPTRSGRSVPLSQIGHLKHGFEPGLIWRRDRLPTITVRANLYGKTQPATIVTNLQPQIDQIIAYLQAIGSSPTP